MHVSRNQRVVYSSCVVIVIDIASAHSEQDGYANASRCLQEMGTLICSLKLRNVEAVANHQQLCALGTSG